MCDNGDSILVLSILYLEVITMTCCFFGHRDAGDAIYPRLYKTLEELIQNRGADNFLVGNHGNFDKMVLRCLKQLQPLYPHIQITVVLAYYPTQKTDYGTGTVYPPEAAQGPARFAIDRANRYMLKCADCVVAYVKLNTGGAARFCRMAKKQNKPVFNLADQVNV